MNGYCCGNHGAPHQRRAMFFCLTQVSSLDFADGPRPGAVCQPASVTVPFFSSSASTSRATQDVPDVPKVLPGGFSSSVCRPVDRELTGSSDLRSPSSSEACDRLASYTRLFPWSNSSSVRGPGFSDGAALARENKRLHGESFDCGGRLLIRSRLRHMVVFNDLQVRRYACLNAFWGFLDSLRGEGTPAESTANRGTDGEAPGGGIARDKTSDSDRQEGKEKARAPSAALGRGDRDRPGKRTPEGQTADPVEEGFRGHLHGSGRTREPPNQGLCILNKVGMSFSVDLTTYQTVDLRTLVVSSISPSAPGTPSVGATSQTLSHEEEPTCRTSGEAEHTPGSATVEAEETEEHNEEKSLLLVKGILPSFSMDLSAAGLDTVFRSGRQPLLESQRT